MFTSSQIHQAYSKPALTVLSACAADDNSYVSKGAKADLLDGTFPKGRHYHEPSGVPVWELCDNSGAVKGSVKGRALTKVAKTSEAWDGGFGSVDSLLYVAHDGKGESAMPSLAVSLMTIDRDSAQASIAAQEDAVLLPGHGGFSLVLNLGRSQCGLQPSILAEYALGTRCGAQSMTLSHAQY